MTDVAKIVLGKTSWFVPMFYLLTSQHWLSTKPSKVNPSFTLDTECDITVPQTTNFSRRLSTKSNPEKPRWMIIGFQSDKSNDQDNPAVFDHERLTNIYVMFNSVRYLAIDYSASFNKCRVARLYKEAADFRRKFFSMDSLVSNPKSLFQTLSISIHYLCLTYRNRVKNLRNRHLTSISKHNSRRKKRSSGCTSICPSHFW